MKRKCVSYAKWGYIFLIPFFLVYIIFQLIPLLSTFYNSFFENYRVGLMQVGPTFVGFKNYKEILFNSELPMYLKNTFIIWMMGFIPQMFFSLLLASWFTDLRLRLKCSGFFKTVIYMPNLIMASAFSMLFYTIFSDVGPINNLLNSMGLPTYRFLAEVAGARGLIALMNFLMWFGNTTIVLMAGIMGIDTGIMEAARIDGASSFQIFRKITMPYLLFVTGPALITDFVKNINNFNVIYLLTQDVYTTTNQAMASSQAKEVDLLVTWLFRLTQDYYNYKMASAIGIIVFIICAVFTLVAFNRMIKGDKEGTYQ